MAKKREDREKKPRQDPGCNLDGDYRSPIRSFQDLTGERIVTALKKSRYLQILLSLTVIGCILRFYNLGFNSLWLDEASTHTFAVRSIPEIWQATTGGEFNPPLFYWAEHIMLTFGDNEFVLRFIPALLGVLVIPLVYIVGKEFFDRNAGIIAAAAVTFSPFLIYYSQEARAYSMMFFFVAAAMVFFLLALKSNSLRDWGLFGLFAALAFWSHFYAIVIIASLVLYALYVQAGKILKDIKNALPLAAGVGVFAVLCLPIFLVTLDLFARRSAGAPTFGIQGFGLIIETFYQLSGSSMIAMVLLLVLFIIGIVQAFITDRNKGVLLVSVVVLTFALSYFLSFRIPMQPRYLIFLSLIYFLGVALAYRPVCSLVSNRAVVYGFIVLVILIGVTTPLFMQLYSGYSKEDWRGLSGQVSKITSSGDYVVVAPGYIYQPFDYYYSNSTDGTMELRADSAADLASHRQLKGNASMYLLVTADITSADPSGDALAWIENNTRLVSRDTGVYFLAVN